MRHKPKQRNPTKRNAKQSNATLCKTKQRKHTVPTDILLKVQTCAPPCATPALSTISSKSVLTTMRTGAATAAAPFEAVAVVSVVTVAVISLNRAKASCIVHTSPLASKAPST